MLLDHTYDGDKRGQRGEPTVRQSQGMSHPLCWELCRRHDLQSCPHLGWEARPLYSWDSQSLDTGYPDVTLFSCDSLWCGNQLMAASWPLPALGVISVYSWRVIFKKRIISPLCHSPLFISLRSTSSCFGIGSFRMPVGLSSWWLLKRRLVGLISPVATNELFSPCSTVHSQFSLHLAGIPFGLCGFPGGVTQALIPGGLSLLVIRPF